jgi:small subunit ribosomal protein S6
MKEYESIFVLDPGLDDAQVDVELERIREFIGSKDAEITEVQKWGRRKLAYEIQKKKEGIYTLFRFKGGSEALEELERRYRLNENLLRHLTVVYEGPPYVEGEEPGEGEGERAQQGGAPAPAGVAAATATATATEAPAAAEAVSAPASAAEAESASTAEAAPEPATKAESAPAGEAAPAPAEDAGETPDETPAGPEAEKPE